MVNAAAPASLVHTLIFWQTGMSIFLGITATLSVNLSKDQENQYGDYETASFAWGFAFMFGIYIGGGVSGAHMNPAISISLALFRGFPWRQCALYIVVQFAASMAAAALAYGVYYDAIHFVDPDLSASYTSFFSSPQEWVSDLSAFFSQFVAGAVMMIAVLALGDDSNNPPGAGLHAFVSPPQLRRDADFQPPPPPNQNKLTCMTCIDLGSPRHHPEVHHGLQHGLSAQPGLGPRPPPGRLSGGLPNSPALCELLVALRPLGWSPGRIHRRLYVV